MNRVEELKEMINYNYSVGKEDRVRCPNEAFINYEFPNITPYGDYISDPISFFGVEVIDEWLKKYKSIC